MPEETKRLNVQTIYDAILTIYQEIDELKRRQKILEDIVRLPDKAIPKSNIDVGPNPDDLVGSAG